jgi:hypothetical protein
MIVIHIEEINQKIYLYPRIIDSGTGEILQMARYEYDTVSFTPRSASSACQELIQSINNVKKNTPRLSVVPLKNRNYPVYSSILQQEIMTEIIASGRYRLLERELIEDLKSQNNGDPPSDQKLLNSEFVLMGTFIYLSVISFKYRIIEVSSGEPVSGKMFTARDFTDLLNQIRNSGS